MTSIKFSLLKRIITEDVNSNLDMLWLASWFLNPQRPGWQGSMHAALEKCSHPGKAEVVFLPMIDLSASDDTCIYSTLHFIATQAKLYNYTPILTFDQPLWWKAMLILENAELSSPIKGIILRLRGFHTLMSFLGCIGHIMEGSGLKELLCLIYADNTVPHMLTGKAYSRAVRGYFLIDSALNALLHSNLFLAARK